MTVLRSILNVFFGWCINCVTLYLFSNRSHTLAYVANTGKIYAFGQGSSGQLGMGKKEAACFHPKICRGAWDTMQPSGIILREMFAGGDQSFAVVSLGSNALPPIDFRRQRPALLPLSLTLTKADQLCIALSKLQDEDSLLEDVLHREFEIMCGSLSGWNGSFLGPGDEHFATGSKVIGMDILQADEALTKLAIFCKAVGAV